jgi:hypothetical protein
MPAKKVMSHPIRRRALDLAEVILLSSQIQNLRAPSTTKTTMGMTLASSHRVLPTWALVSAMEALELAQASMALRHPPKAVSIHPLGEAQIREVLRGRAKVQPSRRLTT